MYINNSIKEYLDDLAARKPAPGGGSAAALGAATGVALMSMVANFTVGNAKYKTVEKDMADMLVKLENAREDLEGLIDKDVEAYSKLSEGMEKFKKGSAELERVFKEAAEPPFAICRIASECLILCKELVRIGNKNLVTDTAIAAMMLEGAFFAAKYNVYINLKYIGDLAFVEKAHKFLSPLEGRMPKLKEEILEACEEVLQK